MNVTQKLKTGIRTCLAAVLVFSIAGLAGCGGDSGTPAANDDATAELAIGFTDAKGDFLHYLVGVKSLSLTKANGTVIETMPLATDVDFAELTEMTEFISITTVPKGIYVKATMVLDYNAAQVMVEGDDGASLNVENIVDREGNTIDTIEVSVRLEGRNKLTILPGVPAHLTLDFDLQASNSVDFASSPLSMIVEPFVLADLQRDAPKAHRARGLLKDVLPDQSAFKVYIRPFFHRLNTPNARRFGSLAVLTHEQTVYEIDGVNYQGDAGLQAMDALQNLASVIAVGRLKRSPFRFEASEVYAGSSVPGGDQDAVQGSVIARDGDVLTVKGASLLRQSGSVQFNDEVSVTIDSDTQVVKQGVIDDGTTSGDISVGQRVRIFGTLTDDNPTNLSMDATGVEKGRVRMLVTQLAGTLNEINDGELVMNLKTINGRNIGIFNFATTASAPANYHVDTGTINTADLGQGQPALVRGFVTPFGQTPPDFSAISVIHAGNKPAELAIIWEAGDTVPFSSMSEDGLLLTHPVSAERLHHVIQGGIFTDINGLDSAVNMASSSDGDGTYIVKEGTALTVHTTFTAMVEDLNARLDGVNIAKGIRGKGQFNWTSNTITSQFIAIVIQRSSVP